jgi:hypothetical protein
LIHTAEFAYLTEKYPQRPFQMGGLALAGRYSGWGFENVGRSRVQHILKQLVEGGVYGLFEKLKITNEYVVKRFATN